MKIKLALLAAFLVVACGRSPDPGSARLIVKGATVRLLVESLDGLESTITRKVEALEGFTTASDLTGTGNDAALTIVFRVPAAKLDVALKEIESLAKKVESRAVRGEDLTEEFVDLEAQRVNLTATRDRLLALMEKSTRVEDALEVNKGLGEVQGQLEKIAGRMKYLQQSSSLSTVTATFYPESRTDLQSGWRPLEVARVALNGLLGVFMALGNLAIFVVVFAPVWGPPIWIYRRRRALQR